MICFHFGVIFIGFIVGLTAASSNEYPATIRKSLNVDNFYSLIKFVKFPASFIKTCNQSDARLGSCIRNSILSLRPHLANGIPELNIPSLEPLFVDEIKITQSGGIQLSAVFKNISITGATNFRLRSVRADVESDKFRMKIWFPSLVMRASYELRGQLLMMPINGRGMCAGNFTDIDGILSMKLKRVNRGDKEHYQVEFMQIEFNIGGAKVQLDNLFENGDAELSRSMNHFINENWRMVTAELRPTLEKTIGDILADVANKFFEVYPIKMLIP